MRKTKNDSDQCTHPCPYRLARLGTSLRNRGKLTLRKRIHSFIILYTLLTISYAGFLPLPLVGYGVSLTFAASLCSSKSGSLAIALPHNLFFFYHHSDSIHRSRMTAGVNCGFYRTVLNTCPSFSNEVKNLGKEYGC